MQRSIITGLVRWDPTALQRLYSAAGGILHGVVGDVCRLAAPEVSCGDAVRTAEALLTIPGAQALV